MQFINHSHEDENHMLLSQLHLNIDSLKDPVILNKASSRSHAYFFALVLAMGNAADAVEIICVSYILSELESSTLNEKVLLSSAVFFGMLLGGIFCGILSDRVGRKPTLLLSLAVNAVAGLLSAVSPNISWLIAFRVIGGLGIGGSVPSVFTLGAEIFPTDIRGRLLSLIASFWMVGSVFVALLGWIMLGDDFQGNRIAPACNWRSFAAACSLPVITAGLASWAFLPESPRFLLRVGRATCAVRSITHITGLAESRPGTAVTVGQIMNPLHHDVHIGQAQSLAVRPETQSSGQTVLTTTVIWKSTPDSYLSNLFRPPLFHSTATLAIIWFSLSFGSYGLSTWIAILFRDVGLSNPYGQAFLFALATLPGNVFSVAFTDRLGRKTLLGWGLCMAAASAGGFALSSSKPVAVVLFASLFNCSTVIAWNSLDILSVEGFPTPVRTAAMGVLAAAGRIGAVIAQVINGHLESNIPLLLVVTSLCMLFGALTTWRLPVDGTGVNLDQHYHGQHGLDQRLSTDEDGGKQ
eukprot:gene5928-11960_t